MRFKDTGAQEEGFFQLTPEQFLLCPLRGFSIAGIFDGNVRMVGSPVVGSAHIFHPAQGQWPGKLKLPWRKILRLARIILIKAPSFDFFVEMVAVEQLPGAANEVSILLEELGQENRVIEDGIVNEGTPVDVVARSCCAKSNSLALYASMGRLHGAFASKFDTGNNEKPHDHFIECILARDTCLERCDADSDEYEEGSRPCCEAWP